MNELCKVQHDRIDETLREHSDKLDKLSVDNATNSRAITDLCTQIGNLTKVLWTLSGGIILAVGTAIINFIIK